MIIIGITGTFGAGKGTIVEYLKTKGFVHYSVRDFLVEEIKRRGMKVDRDSMYVVANDLRAKYEPSYIVTQLRKQAEEAGYDKVIIESIRNVGEVETLRVSEGFFLLAIDTDSKLRYKRIRKRGGEKDNVTYEEFVAKEEQEMKASEKHEQNISACMAMADYTLRNDGTLGELHAQVDKVLEGIEGK